MRVEPHRSFPNYCSQNGGNLHRAPYYNGNLNIGPRIIGNLDQSPHGDFEQDLPESGRVDTSSYHPWPALPGRGTPRNAVYSLSWEVLKLVELRV